MKPAKPITVTDGLARAFWAKVDKGEGDACWLWIGGKHEAGYGLLQGYRASRVSFAIHYYDAPADREVCHTCDNPQCVRPDHLVIGSHAENMRDCGNKGRGGGFTVTGTIPKVSGEDNAFRMKVLELGKAGKQPSEIARELRVPFRRVMKIRDSHTVSEGGSRKYA